MASAKGTSISNTKFIEILKNEERMQQYIRDLSKTPKSIDSRIWRIHFSTAKKKQMKVLNSFVEEMITKKKIIASYLPKNLLLATVYKTCNIPYETNPTNDHVKPVSKKSPSLKYYQNFYNLHPKKLPKPTTDLYTFTDDLKPIVPYEKFRSGLNGNRKSSSVPAVSNPPEVFKDLTGEKLDEQSSNLNWRSSSPPFVPLPKPVPSKKTENRKLSLKSRSSRKTRCFERLPIIEQKCRTVSKEKSNDFPYVQKICDSPIDSAPEQKSEPERERSTSPLNFDDFSPILLSNRKGMCNFNRTPRTPVSSPKSQAEKNFSPNTDVEVSYTGGETRIPSVSNSVDVSYKSESDDPETSVPNVLETPKKKPSYSYRDTTKKTRVVRKLFVESDSSFSCDESAICEEKIVDESDKENYENFSLVDIDVTVQGIQSLQLSPERKSNSTQSSATSSNSQKKIEDAKYSLPLFSSDVSQKSNSQRSVVFKAKTRVKQSISKISLSSLENSRNSLQQNKSQSSSGSKNVSCNIRRPNKSKCMNSRWLKACKTLAVAAADTAETSDKDSDCSPPLKRLVKRPRTRKKLNLARSLFHVPGYDSSDNSDIFNEKSLRGLRIKEVIPESSPESDQSDKTLPLPRGSQGQEQSFSSGSPLKNLNAQKTAILESDRNVTAAVQPSRSLQEEMKFESQDPLNRLTFGANANDELPHAMVQAHYGFFSEDEIGSDDLDIMDGSDSDQSSVLTNEIFNLVSRVETMRAKEKPHNAVNPDSLLLPQNETEKTTNSQSNINSFHDSLWNSFPDYSQSASITYDSKLEKAFESFRRLTKEDTDLMY